jgi:hypothetical protein
MIGADDAEVTQSSDSPGFIANAILMPMLNEAILVLEKVWSIDRSQEAKLTIGNRDCPRYRYNLPTRYGSSNGSTRACRFDWIGHLSEHPAGSA